MKRIPSYLKIAGKALVIILIALVVFLLAGSLALYLNREHIKQKFVEELNKSINTEIRVEHIGVSMFKEFPYASVTFDHIQAGSTIPKDRTPFLDADHVYLHFNIFDLIRKNYSIKRIHINHAVFHLKTLENGEINYQFWKTGGSSSGVAFRLKKVRIKSSDFIYDDRQSLQYFAYHIHRLSCSGDFQNEMTDIHADGDIFIHKHINAGYTVAEKKNAELKADFSVNTDKHLFMLKSSELTLENFHFNVNGQMSFAKGKESVDFSIAGNRISLKELLDAMPHAYQAQMKHWQGEGILDFQMKIKGSIAGANLPNIQAQFSMQQAQINIPSQNINIRKINFRGTFNNGVKHNPSSYFLDIKQINFQVNEDQMTGQLQIQNFVKPNVMISGHVNFDLENIYKLFKIKQLAQWQGKGQTDFTFENTFTTLDSISAKDIAKANISGMLTAQNIQCNDPAFYKANFPTLKVELDGPDLIIDQLQGNWNGSDLRINGRLADFWPFCFDQKQKLRFTGDIKSDNLLTDKLFSSPSAEEHKTKASDDEPSFLLPDFINFQLHLSADQFQYKQIKGTALTASLSKQGHNVKVENLSASLLDGRFTGNIRMDEIRPEGFVINADVQCQSVDLSKTFLMFSNFGQSTLTGNHLQGKLTANTQLSMHYDLKNGLDTKSLLVHSETKVEKGALNNFDMMQQLSRFMDEESLKNIKFSTLENTIDIKNEAIYIPEMKINMNDMNFSISGIHKFNNEINYSLNIKLSELLSKRRRAKHQNQEDFGVVEDDGSRLSIFILVYGTTDHPKFRYDSKSANKRLNDNLQKEKSDIKNVIDKEFNLSKQREERIRLQEQQKIQEQGRFVIEPEEEPNQAPVKKETTKNSKGFNVTFEDD